MPFVSTGLTVEARDALRAAALDLTSPAGQRLSMSAVLLGALAVAGKHRDEWIDALRDAVGDALRDAPDSPVGGR